MSIRSMLRSSATIQRATVAATTFSSGGKKTWANLYLNIDCDVQPVSAHELASLGREQAYCTHTMYCVPGDVPLAAASDKVVFDSREFEIVGPPRDTDSVGRLLAIDLLERVGVAVD